jgi:hypothetical protein
MQGIRMSNITFIPFDPRLNNSLKACALGEALPDEKLADSLTNLSS